MRKYSQLLLPLDKVGGVWCLYLPTKIVSFFNEEVMEMSAMFTIVWELLVNVSDLVMVIISL